MIVSGCFTAEKNRHYNAAVFFLCRWQQPGDTLLLLGDEERGIAIPHKRPFSELFTPAFAEDKGGDSK